MFNMLRAISCDKSHAGLCGRSCALLRAKGHVIGHVSSYGYMLVGVRVQVMCYFPRVMCSELKFVTPLPLHRREKYKHAAEKKVSNIKFDVQVLTRWVMAVA